MYATYNREIVFYQQLETILTIDMLAIVPVRFCNKEDAHRLLPSKDRAVHTAVPIQAMQLYHLGRHWGGSWR